MFVKRNIRGDIVKIVKKSVFGFYICEGHSWQPGMILIRELRTCKECEKETFFFYFTDENSYNHAEY